MLRLLAVLVWSTAYFSVSYTVIRRTWGMSIFKIKQWVKLFKEWRSGQWIVDTTNEYTLCSVLLLLIPVWIITTLIIYRLIRSKQPSVANIVQTTAASQPFIPAYTPASMPSQGKSAVLETPPASAEPPLETPSAGLPEKTDWVPKDDTEAQALDTITELAEENGLTPFPHVLLENELIPITISSDVDAFLIKVLATDGLWQVGLTEPLEQSVWSCNDQAKTVLKEIILGKGVLSKMEPESQVVPVVVLARGSLEKTEEVLSWLNQKGVEVVTLPENQQPGIPQLSDVLVKYFGQFEKQEELNDKEETDIIQNTPST